MYVRGIALRISLTHNLNYLNSLELVLHLWWSETNTSYTHMLTHCNNDLI